MDPNVNWGSILTQSINQKKVKVGVVGLGYVGLPLAVEFARAGLKVTGIDLDTEKVKSLVEGKSYIQDVSSEDIRDLIKNGMFSATDSYDVVKDLDSLNICVPTPLRKTKDPDLTFIISAVQEVKKNLRAGQLIILESTTYPGTTEEILIPILSENGFTVGKDFFLAFSPERVDPGNLTYNTKNTPKVVGGITPTCTKLAVSLYRQAIPHVIPVSSTKVAEMVKLLENTFRSVNIAMVNEIALMSHKLGIDVWEVIDAASTKPFGFMPFYPGPGIGGHCIPIDPHYLSWKAKQNGFEARLIDLAGQINGQMPEHVVNKITDSLNDQGKSVKNARIMILGVAYKPDIDDLRESPALDVMTLLIKKGAQISYYDPYVRYFNLGDHQFTSASLENGFLSKFDCVVIITHHTSINYKQIVRESSLVVDTRNALKGFREPHIVRL